jgi:hypothetical protein
VPPPHAPSAKDFTLAGYSFSRSYGVNLPSSLTRITSRLRILSSPTCVGLGYGFLIHSLEAFLGGMGSPTYRPKPRHHLSELTDKWICLLVPPTSLHRHIQQPAGLPFRVPPSLNREQRSTGILTSCPSPTPFGLSLGTDSPWEDNLAQEPLGFWRGGFSPPLSLLMPTFSLLSSPPRLSV